MTDSLTRIDVAAILQRLTVDLPTHAEELRELDAAIGDGDLGITVTLGMDAVAEALPNLTDGDIGQLLTRTGMAFNRKAASTFGALYATMMMRAGRVAKGLEKVSAEQVAEMAHAAAQGVMDRGKAQVGDKTLLDALVPAADALGEAVEAGESLAEALTLAAEAARVGVEHTKALKSKVGRSSWFADRTEGIADPGATAIYLMLQSVAQCVAERG